MILTAIQFIRAVYPVLKESIIGKQSLTLAYRTSKIKLLVLLYLLVSPLILYYAAIKSVNLAADNVRLVAKDDLSEFKNTQCRTELKTLRENTGSCVADSSNQHLVSKPFTRSADNHPVKNTRNHQKPTSAEVDNSQTNSTYNSKLNKHHEHY